MKPAADRMAIERAGRRAEGLAALWLQLKGYAILARRAQTPLGEIDIIARRGAVLAFVEVKQRRGKPDLGQLVSRIQMSRIVRAATGWAGQRKWAAQCRWRYDIILIRPWRWPVHLRDAWRPSLDPILERRAKGVNVM